MGKLKMFILKFLSESMMDQARIFRNIYLTSWPKLNTGLSLRHKPTTVLYLTLLLVLGCLSLTQTVWAGETIQEKFPDRLKVYGGYQHLFDFEGKYRFDGTDVNQVNFTKDLGGDRSDNMIVAGAIYRLNQNHAIGFSWYEVNLDGERILDEEVEINDKIFQVGGNVDSDIELSLYRLFYNWSFYRNGKTELKLSPGIYVADFEGVFIGSAVIDEDDINPIGQSDNVDEDLSAPLPTIGLEMEYQIYPRLKANFRTDFFYVDVGEVDGYMAEFNIKLEYRVFKHFAVGAGAGHLLFDLEYKDGNPKGFATDFSWNRGLIYGALYF
jgi:hypothetical protein